MFEYRRRVTLIPSQKWGWRLRGDNYEIVATSGAEGFSSKHDVDRNAKLALKMLQEHFQGEIN